LSRGKRARKALLRPDRHWYREGQTGRHHKNLLPEVLHPMILCVKKAQRNHLVLHIHRNRDLHREAALELLRRGCLLEEMQEAALLS
jgi:hypothetical protein